MATRSERLRAHPDFDLPSRGSVSGRTSSITAAFFQAITPVIEPADADVDEVLELLGMRRGACCCAYCGDARTEWDHFRPTVVGRRPTGYITEIANLVPACGKCNQSKGNKDWRAWMFSQASRAPARRGIDDLDNKVARLEAFAAWRTPTRIDYEALLGDDVWQDYLEHLDRAVGSLNDAQTMAKHLRALVAAALPARE